MLRKVLPNFQHYVKKIKAQPKKKNCKFFNLKKDG